MLQSCIALKIVVEIVPCNITLKGLWKHDCLVYFVNNAKYTSLFNRYKN